MIERTGDHYTATARVNGILQISEGATEGEAMHGLLLLTSRRRYLALLRHAALYGSVAYGMSLEQLELLRS